MKHLRKLTRPIGVRLLILPLALLATLNMIGCGGKDGGANSGRNGRYNYLDSDCNHNCAGVSDFLASAIGWSDQRGAEFGVEIFIAENGGNYGPEYGSYDGPVVVEGLAHFNRDGGYDCPIEKGYYKLKTIQAGQWTSIDDTVRNVILEGDHEGSSRDAVFRIDALALNGVQPSLRDEDGHTFPYGLIGYVSILEADEIPCETGAVGLPPLNQMFLSY